MTVVKTERRIDACLLEKDWFRPLARRVVSKDIEIATRGNIGCHQIKQPLMIAQGRREDALRTGNAGESHLAVACQTMPDLSPVDQVAAVEEGDSGKVLKA